MWTSQLMMTQKEIKKIKKGVVIEEEALLRTIRLIQVSVIRMSRHQPPGTVSSPTVSVTNSTSGTYTVSWSAASNMDTSGPGQQGYELLEYKNGSFVKTYHTSPTTRTQSISS